MKENQVSFTALMTACIRAYHSKYAEPKIFDDFLAYSLIPEDSRKLIEQILPKEALMHATNAISRARYVEDLLEMSVAQGVKQYVILGAGMDTFAFRRPEIVEKKLKVFEIDHPATQDFKRRRITELGWAKPEQLHFIPVDFTQESLAKRLTNSSYDPEAMSLFSWLGVTMYLNKDEVFSTLQSIHDVAPVGSIIVFDYYDLDEFIAEKASANLKKKEEMMQKIGEPMKTGFDPTKLGIELTDIGFSLLENLSPSDIEERYFNSGKNSYHAHKNVHFACASIK